MTPWRTTSPMPPLARGQKSISSCFCRNAQALSRNPSCCKTPPRSRPTNWRRSPGQPDALDAAIARAKAALLAKKDPGGWWCFEFEADVTIPAEYILLLHFLGKPDRALEDRICVYIRRIQGEDGAWPLYPDGEGNLSCTVKAYYALKIAGADVNDPALAKARDWIKAHGGAEKVNMFTRIMLAMFGQIPYRALPAMPAEVILLPLWFPFNMYNIATWSRTVIAPLLILLAKKPVAENPYKIGVAELFNRNPADVAYFKPKNLVDRAFGLLDAALHWVEPHIPAKLRQKSIDKALAFTLERLNGEDGLNGIFPAMANALMAMHVLGFTDDDPNKAVCRKSIDRLLHDRGDEVYCQPCLSPTWDTAIALHALLEAGAEHAEVKDALDWLASKQISAPGDWRKRAPGVVSGGWAFQFNNPCYPDLDDTAMVASALDRANKLKAPMTPPRTPRSSAPTPGSLACKARPAVLRPMTRTTTRNISTAFPSPITAPCSTRIASTFPRAASATSRSAATVPAIRRWRGRSVISSRSRSRTARGTDVGASITSMACGRRWSR